jgi:hypothetical protein
LPTTSLARAIIATVRIRIDRSRGEGPVQRRIATMVWLVVTAIAAAVLSRPG